jgi:hypothetical protein
VIGSLAISKLSQSLKPIKINSNHLVLESRYVGRLDPLHATDESAQKVVLRSVAIVGELYLSLVEFL